MSGSDQTNKKRMTTTQKVVTGVAAATVLGIGVGAVYWFGFRQPDQAKLVAQEVKKDPEVAKPETKTEQALMDELVAFGVENKLFAQITNGNPDVVKIVKDVSDVKKRLEEIATWTLQQGDNGTCVAKSESSSMGAAQPLHLVVYRCGGKDQAALWASSSATDAKNWADTFNLYIESAKKRIVANATTVAPPAAPASASPPAPAQTAPFYYRGGYW